MGTTDTKRDLGGTIRMCPPEETLARITPWLEEFGITRVANVTGLDRVGIPVFLCVRPNARALSVSQGKGPTDDLARVSAIMESIELWHAERVVADARTASCEDLVADAAAFIDPTRLMPGLCWDAFRPDKDMIWRRGTCLVSGQPTWVPDIYVNLDFCLTQHPNHSWLDTSTNGLASGNSLDEALCHALYEVIERQCDAAWNDSAGTAIRQTQIDTHSVDTPALRAMIDTIETAGLSVLIWDLTSALGIPVVRCNIQTDDPLRGLSTFSGIGCHLSRDVALSRALTEAAQSRLTVISGSRDDMSGDFYDEMRAISGQQQVMPKIASRDYEQIPQIPLGKTFREDVEFAVGRLVEQGFGPPMYIDHTRPPFDIPVVHVVVPGTEHRL